MRAPTLNDVARAAGVSYSTADRVLNERGGVAERSQIKVQRAIEALGYKRDIHAANLSRGRFYAFRFYLPDADHGFFNILRKAVVSQAKSRAIDRISVSLHDVPLMDSDALSAQLDQIKSGDCDCVALVSADTPRLVQSIARLAELGVPVVTLVSDTAHAARAAYIGIDNLSAGRTAGRLLRMAHRGTSGCILPILGSLHAMDHAQRLEGMRLVLGEPGPTLRILDPVETRDRPEQMTAALEQIIRAGDEISGIYSIGAANRALLGLLDKMTMPRPFTVIHELTDHARRGIENGLVDAVIDQKPHEEAALALEVMHALADDRPAPSTRSVTSAIYLKDNLPALSESENIQ